jgi:lysozyme family protein
MTHSTYDAFLTRLIKRYEGGYGWDKGDPGGPTKYGITCYDLAEHRGEKMTSMSAWAQKVKDMPLTEAEDIYWIKYAVGVNYNALPAGPDVVMLDYAVNSGVERAVLVARELVKMPGSNKQVDPTLTAAIARAGPQWFIEAMDKERLGFMHRIKNGAAWKEFGGGWGARVNDLDLYALALAKNAPLPTVDPKSASEVKLSTKAIHPAPDPTAHTTRGLGTIFTTAVAGGAAGVPMSYLIAFVLGGAALAGAYYLYEKYAAAKVNAVVTAVETPVSAAAVKAKAPTGSTGTSK